MLDPSARDVKDVVHAVVAVGSRNKEKAQEFVSQNVADGGWAQKCGLVKTPPQAFGSYPEVWNHKVGGFGI